MTTALNHGGQLTQIAQRYSIAIEQWLDLSTGIAPRGYPVAKLSADIWRRLPEPSSELISAAQHYYATPHILPIPGSQSIIQQLPALCALQGYINGRVWLPVAGYQEHHKAWQQAGVEIVLYQNFQQLESVTQQDIVVLINPNNPTGELFSKQQVLALFEDVSQQQGLLIIDEAFMDCTPEHSFLYQLPSDNLIILRSLGKFFGLAGIRLGFVAAAPKWLTLCAQLLGPWALNGPAQAIGTLALKDHQWQQQQRQYLQKSSGELKQLLAATFQQQSKGTGLFQTLSCSNAAAIFDALCLQGIYVRLCDGGHALRFGLPTEQGFVRLQQALSQPAISQKIIRN